ncbi:ThuA domain-containing protein [Oerskovia flava]|uniref:ThuA domain-containing protein n=1 Tax=Oerskovia flava TaxID=2986422 RepID=UPI002240276A|nr:ThuA domain-containing protein [Oerskovia sp. JB1-3-2]
MTQRVRVLAGRGRYEDPWHDHAATSHRVAVLLGALPDVDVEVRSTFPDALDDLDGPAGPDLLVVNCGRGEPGDDDAAWAPLHGTLSRWARAGGAVLGLHQAANTFPDAPDWQDVLGGRWIPGESMHPPFGEARVTVRPGHEVTRGLGDVDVLDERYCFLRTRPGIEVLATVEHDGNDHPVVWAHEAHGGRTVYDGLGHDVRSYDSAGRVDLLRRSATWLLGREPQG